MEDDGVPAAIPAGSANGRAPQPAGAGVADDGAPAPSPAGVAVTGAAGYLGGVFLDELARRRLLAPAGPWRVLALDVREVPPERRIPGVAYAVMDVRDPALAEALRRHRARVVVHLATLLAPGRASRDVQYDVEVRGTENVLEACAEAGVARIVVASSGAAYGYHPDNPFLLSEDHPLRGNEEFPYAHHKRLVEELLARWRRDRPGLEQVVFRIGTILGDGNRSPVTALFEKPVLLGVRGSESPFVFAWDRDVAGCLVAALDSPRAGVYNVAGDGVLPASEIAAVLGRPLVRLPAPLLAAALAVLRRVGLTRYGPEQVRFLRYRPVLDNRRLKEEFGFSPARTGRQTLEAWAAAARRRAGGPG